MVRACVAGGLRAAGRQWRLAVLLWICGLWVAAIATLPALWWWRDLVGYAPEADRMLDGIRVGVLAELLRGENWAGWRVLAGTGIGVLLAARIAHAFVIGGIVDVLAAPADVPTSGGASRASSSEDNRDGLAAAAAERARIAGREQITAYGMAIGEDERRAAHETGGALPVVSQVAGRASASPGLASPEVTTVAPTTSSATAVPPPGGERAVLPRFFDGGARFFLRNLVILLVNAVAAALIGFVFLAVGRAIVRPLEDTLSAPLAWVRLLLPLALPSFVVFFFLLVNDYAAIRLVVSDSRRPLRTWLSALGFVARRFVASASIWISVGLILGLVLTAYVAFRNTVATTAWLGIAWMIAIQQTFMLTRAALRIATVSAELNYATKQGFVTVPRGAAAGSERRGAGAGEQVVASSLPLARPGGEGDIRLRSERISSSCKPFEP